MIKAGSLTCVALLIGGISGYHLGSQQNTSGPDVEDVSRESGPQDFTKKWQRAFEAGNFNALRDLYEPDAWLMAQGQPARKGVDDIIAYLQRLKASGMTADVQTLDEHQVTDSGYSFSTTRWWFEYPMDNGETVRDSGRSFTVFKKGADGRWRLWRAIKNQSPDVQIPDDPT